MLEIFGYRISDKIYESSRHLVYRAVRQRDDLPVVLKVLRNEYPDPEESAAFEREYRLTRSFEGQGSIRAYGLEKLGHTLCMVLEDFGGQSLTRLAQETDSEGFWSRPGFYDLPAFLSLALQITHCLGLIHNQNIVHKDINPDNIVYNPHSKQLKIIDFGISSELSEENPQISTPQVLEGNLAYISPEQTGRMNRTLDYRSDFYSLGLTLYRLLTGELPFTSADPLEMVHSHIARQPESPLEVIRRTTELKQGLAGNLQIISEIILKLLAKDAEERYQSAFGLKHDLDRCLQELKAKNKISKFEIASRDIPEQLCIPEKLYGRENELKILQQAFERISRGQCEMLLVKGYSGIGKSTLVEELRGPLSQGQAYFICGKFDQLQRDKPYLALIEALRDMAGQILTESSERFGLWRTELQNVLGQNARVICEVIPEVEQIIDPQAEVPELPPEENRNRFRYLFSKFISALASQGLPLVLFLDDLQWADLPSLQLLEFFLGRQPEYILLIGAFRENVIEPGHPLLLTLENLRQAGMNPQEATLNQEEPRELKDLPQIRTITLQPLGLEDIKSLLAETLKTGRQKVHNLAGLCLEKTAGNPFFLNQFIRTLYQEKLIRFERQRGHWEWETGKISEFRIADNVIDLMSRKIGSLSSSAVEALKHAACIGSTFDLQTLALILEESKPRVSRLIWEALQQGLLKSRDESYRLAGSANHVFYFLHDKVQKAAYLLIAQDKRNRLHLKIGRLLLKNLDTKEREERVFDLVNQFNPALDLISEDSERKTLAGLNLLAGKRAKASAAYKSAEEYLQNGLVLLSEASWHTNYELALELHNQAVQVAFLNAAYPQKDQEVRIEESKICLSGENQDGPAVNSPARQVSTGDEDLPKSLLQYILRTRQQVLVNDTGQENKFSQDPYLADGTPRAMLGLPILSGGKLTGVLYLENDLATDVFTPERLQVLQLLASQTAISIQNAKLYGQLENLVQERTRELTEANNKLEELTVTDSLTGVYNRLKFDELMAGELKRSRRYKRPCSVILIDLDDFKLINDNLGHLTGDMVLQELSLILQKNIRETDFLCRWGGEEFAILCPETNQDKVMELAEKIRKLVAEHDFECQKLISISLGATTLQAEDSRQSMFYRADRALYKSKSQGKNTCNFM